MSGHDAPEWPVTIDRNRRSRCAGIPNNYKRFKEWTAQWVDLSIEHSRLKMKLARES